jgi:hypothetical protein
VTHVLLLPLLPGTGLQIVKAKPKLRGGRQSRKNMIRHLRIIGRSIITRLRL